MRKERKRPQGRMGGGRKQKEMEERKRKGRVLSLWSSAGLSGVTVGRKGRKHVLAEGTGSVPRGHHTPPAAARTCLWLGSGRSVHKWKCQPFGIWGFDHQGPDAKASHPCPSPTAAFTLTPAWLSCVAPPPDSPPQDGSGPAPPQPARESLGASVGIRKCMLSFQIQLYVRPLKTWRGDLIPFHLPEPNSGDPGTPYSKSSIYSRYFCCCINRGFPPTPSDSTAFAPAP